MFDENMGTNFVKLFVSAKWLTIILFYKRE